MKIRLKQGDVEIRCELLNTTDSYFVVINKGMIEHYDRRAWKCFVVKIRKVVAEKKED